LQKRVFPEQNPDSVYPEKVPDLKHLLARLKRHYGSPAFPPAKGPFELILWENACYLLPDTRRAEVFEALRDQVGLTAEKILAATQTVLLPLAKRGGMRPETRVFRWREIARITLDQFGGDLNALLKLPYKDAKKALKQFPNIGDPAAEKILLFSGVTGELPLESNGLRVLTRFGFGHEQKNYGATYRSVQEAIAADLPRGSRALAQAHVLLREHGQTLCKRSGPDCDACPVADVCSFSLAG
jgi:endonuclease III